MIEKCCTKIKEFLLDLFFPNRCIFCDDVIPTGFDKWICPDCIEFTEINYDDVKNVMFLYVYKGYVKPMLHRFKYYNHKEYAVKLGELLAKRFLYSDKGEYDLIVPVPMFDKKKKKRGYNQAELLANEMSKCLDIPVNSTSLIRTEYTEAQSLKTLSDRMENVRNVFDVCCDEEIRDKRIILVDDIYTSGSTARECMNALKKAGALQISTIVVSMAAHNVDK